MTKQHSNFSSAFALNEHAEIRFDRFGQDKYPVARIDGIMLYGENVIYRLSLFVNEGTVDAPKAFLHQGRPVDGFFEADLLSYPGTSYRGEEYDSRPDANQNIVGAKYQIGDLVQIAIDIEPEQTDFHNIPVLITTVGYEPGKVIYGVSIDRAEYRDTAAWDDIYEGRYVRDCLSHLDSILIQPVGGWEAYYATKATMSGRTDASGPNPNNPDSDKDDGIGYMC